MMTLQQVWRRSWPSTSEDLGTAKSGSSPAILKKKEQKTFSELQQLWLFALSFVSFSDSLRDSGWYLYRQNRGPAPCLFSYS